MQQAQIVNSVNLYSGTDFPYLVLNVDGERGTPENTGFHTVHWHEDIQFVLVSRGTVFVKTLDARIVLAQGEGLFINKNVVHFIDKSDGAYQSFIFPDYFLKFYFGAPAERLANKLIGQNFLPVYKFCEEQAWHSDVLEKLRTLSELEKNKDDLYPYRVLCTLSSLWLLMLSNIPAGTGKKETTASARTKRFLEYIHGHYSEPISLTSIADAAHVSVSEILRCFKSNMNTTPYKYVTELRLQKSAEMLKNTHLTIAEISDMSGFCSLSHFGKCFKEKTGYSPKEYRNKNRSL